jgi:Ca2+-transporting ATPase/DNA polymerase kappa
MSHFHGEKDDSTSPTQKTLDRFFQSSDNNSNTNRSFIDASGSDNCRNDVETKDECSIHNTGKDVSVDLQAFSSHNEKLSVSEGMSSINHDNKPASSNMKVFSQPLDCNFLIPFCSQEKRLIKLCSLCGYTD